MSLLGSVFKQLSKATVSAGGEAAEQLVKKSSKKGAKVISGVDPKSLGIKHVSDNVTAFYQAQDTITAGNLTKWGQIGELKTSEGKSLGTLQDFNNEVIKAIDQDDPDAYMNVLGLLDGVDQEIPKFDQAQRELTVSAGLVSPSMAGQDRVQLQALARQDKGKIQEVAKKTPNKQQQGQLASATANVTTQP